MELSISYGTLEGVRKAQDVCSAEAEKPLYRSTCPHGCSDKTQDAGSCMLWAQIPQPHALEIL